MSQKPKVKKPSTTRLKSTKLSVKQDPRTPKLSETLQVKDFLKFQSDLPKTPPPYLDAPSPPSGDLLDVRAREGSELSQATSTPLLASRSSYRDLITNAVKYNMSDITPVRKAELEDEVFQEQEQSHSSLQKPSRHLSSVHNSSLQEEQEVFDPTPEKSFVNRSRGRPKLAGPAASLFNHFGHQATLHIGHQSTLASPPSHLSSFSRRGGQKQDITVMIACVCGDQQITESQVDDLLLLFYLFLLFLPYTLLPS